MFPSTSKYFVHRVDGSVTEHVDVSSACAELAKPSHVPSKPYRVTVWQGAYIEKGAFATFAEALECYRGIADHTKQLVNEDRAECGRDGLTIEERDEVAAVSYAEELAS